MAAAFRAQTTTSNTSHQSSLSLTKPTGTVEGDMIIFGISLTQGDLDTNLTPPAGVTQQIAGSHFGGSGEVGGTMCFKSAGASEGSSYSFSWSVASEYAAIALTYSDADTTIGGTGITSAFNPSSIRS